MTDQRGDPEKRLLAAALFELRVLLSSHIDPTDASPAGAAAAFAYALHNDALAVLEGKPFDVEAALVRIDALAPRLGDAWVRHFRRYVADVR